MWKYYNPNPSARNVHDCSVRAVAKALNISWEDAYILIADAGLNMNDMPSTNTVWGAVLRQHGFRRFIMPNRCPDGYTVKDFCREHPRGIYVIGTDGHVLTAIDGVYYDSWNSGNECPLFYWTI